ncbi:MAG: GIY-YIG nuclease family protein [Cyclobacteriaceae bacterium]|nr:GIY-YIG nuclease family protein [Cyclobacteriaceae bacterium]
MYAIVDIETTGGYAENHRVTEVAIYHHDGLSVTDRFHTLINPGRRVPYFITGLTGITTEMVMQAPAFEEVAEEIYDWLKDRVFVAHNAHFDYSFLKKEFDDVGINWTTKKLCTVRLGRKIVPGLDSYSLGRLAESLGIAISDRHRAGGDAEATAKIFDLLLKRDTEGVIVKALKRNSGETILPPNLPKEEFDRLPAKAGVYYFYDGHGNVIYVGKAINIKKRIAGHFSGDAREWNRSNIRNEIHHIQYELTGNELIALILESQEIRKRWPKYNLAQKYRSEEWGIFDYEDRNGYLRLVINQVGRNTKPLISFSTKGDAWNFLSEKVRESDLCPKLSGLQTAKDPCYAHQSGTCKGACDQKETPKKYNKRVQKSIDSFFETGETVAIIGKGRRVNEKSLVLIEKGAYLGYGFFSSDEVIRDFESAKNYITTSKENRVVQNLVNSYLIDPRGAEIVEF